MDKKIVDTIVNVGTQVLVSRLLQNEIKKNHPELYQIEGKSLTKEDFLKLVKVVGVSVGVALTANLAAYLTQTLIDAAFFPESKIEGITIEIQNT